MVSKKSLSDTDIANILSYYRSNRTIVDICRRVNPCRFIFRKPFTNRGGCRKFNRLTLKRTVSLVEHRKDTGDGHVNTSRRCTLLKTDSSVSLKRRPRIHAYLNKRRTKRLNESKVLKQIV